ncbi:MAG: hypothetical protein J1E82_06795 [Muribaculaceae bacterium]|nr:hypothetical protein [Muribaculaceae bacterium]
MGVISWFKNKYNESKFQKANKSISEGDISRAIELLKKILSGHPEAPSTLLSIYHNQIKEKNSGFIPEVADLYEGYTELKSEIISFASEISKSLPQQALEYCDKLYSKGIKELENIFVKVGTQLVLNNTDINNLNKISKQTTLLKALSESLFTESKKNYNNSQIQLADRICKLITPYLNSKEFYNLIANIRFDLISNNQINASSINFFDELFKDIRNKYKLSNSSINKLTDKGLKKALERFNSKDYVASLLISQRLIDIYCEAKKIYSDSALNLYSTARENNLVIPEILYKSLGNKDSELLEALEAFIPYENHKNKYIELASRELKRLMLGNVEEASKLFEKVWKLAPTEKLIESILTSGIDVNKVSVAKFLLSNYDEIIKNETYFNTFVQNLIKLQDIDFILSTLETFLSKGEKVEKEYVSQIKRQTETAKSKSRKRVEIIEQGLSVYESDELFILQGYFLNDYVDSGRYDDEYATKVAISLKGKSPLSDIIQAKILLNAANKASNLTLKEQKLRSALEFKRSHNQLFDIASYQNILPLIESQLLETATSYFDTNRQKAIDLFYLLRDNDLNWYETYANLYLNAINKNEPNDSDASLIISIINEGSDVNYLIKDTLWSKYVETKISLLSKENLDKEISGLAKLKTELEISCNSSNKDALITSVDDLRSKKYYDRGKQYEKNKDFSNAISDYEQTLNLSGIYPDIQSRILICKIKSGKRLLKAEKELIETILSTNKNKNYQRDLAFRWCLNLICNNKFNDAEEINQKILGGDPEITQICQEEKIKHQQNLLDSLNNQIEKLNNYQLSPEEALTLGKSLSNIFGDINLIVQVTSQKSNALKETIRIYAIEKFYENEDYLECISGLKVQDSAYLNDPIALRNIAIMCLGAAEAGLLSKENYKEFLSIWATALYQQKIFVDSLDYTSWDDPYTFSLDEAFGKLDIQDEDLPDNVNYSDCNVPGVVSIREVQKNLLSRMESAIKDNSEFQLFLSSQLEAMDKLSEQDLDEPCVIVAPYLLLLSNTYRKNVINSLSVEEQAHYDNWETILEIGNLYGINEGAFGTYSQALEYQKKAVESIRRKVQLSSNFNSARISSIKKYNRLFAELISSITTEINADISNEIEYNNFKTIYGPIIKIIGDESMAFVFSNYINQRVVKKLNDKSLTLAQGAPILWEIYGFCNCNPHLKRNLENIIEALIHNYITDGDANNISVLESILSSTRQFDSQIINALKGGDGVPEEMMATLFLTNEARFNNLKSHIGSKSVSIQNQFNATARKMAEIKVQIELSNIVDKVNNNTMTKKVALEKVYNIYKNNKNNVRVCQNLATLISMCIMEYIIPGKAGKVGVENILDSLKLNRSFTFNSHNSEIRQAYNEIWGHLPYDLKNVIQTKPWMLSDQGEAIKKGIDYLKDLS